MAQASVSKLTSEKKVETKKINPTASLVSHVSHHDLYVFHYIWVHSQGYEFKEMGCCYPSFHLNTMWFKRKLGVKGKACFHMFPLQTQQRSTAVSYTPQILSLLSPGAFLLKDNF